MSSLLNKNHFETILNFSRKISKGVNSDDLSQYVILKLLNEPNLINDDVASKPKALKVWLYRFINIEYSLCSSSFNRYFYNSYSKGREVIDVEITDSVIKQTSNNILDNTIDVYGLVKSSGVTDIERMYLNAYIDSDYNYRRCSDNLDIDKTTIKKHVKKALKKCRDTAS